jgi:hypothetical protein
MTPKATSEEYVRLALAIEQHRRGFIDAYFGPTQWQQESKAAGKLPLDDLVARAAALADAVAAEVGMDDQRRDYLSRQVRAMQTRLRLMSGEPMSLADETEALYDVRPAWIPESRFEEAHRRVSDVLPGAESLLERMVALKHRLEITFDQAVDLLPSIEDRLRSLTRGRFPLPEGESAEIHYVSDKPWGGYNWYLGDSRSRIEINRDFPPRLERLVALVAHEMYPGHHTELSNKDSRLHLGAGWSEHCLQLLNSPASAISEGIATSALLVIMQPAELQAWYEHELLPRVGLDPGLAPAIVAFAEVVETLGDASDNAAFMIHEQGANEQETAAYVERYCLLTEHEARKRVDFIKDPDDRSYVFTYGAGRRLLKELFAARGDVTYWFTRVLTEPVTPSQIREWIRAA